jgi:hypothetical protein
MSLQIPVAFVDQFKANILSLSQQKQSKLRGVCRMESVTGDTMYVERIGPKDAQLRGARHGETPISDAEHTRRKLSMADYIVPADLIDKPDKLKLLIDPQSVYTQNQVFSLNRAIDDVIITAIFGAAYSGHTGGTTVNFYDVGECRLIESSGVIVTAGSDWTNTTETPLTIAKLLTCKQLLDDAEIDPERQRYFLTNPYNINQLMNTTEVKSADFNTVRALAQGQVDSFMGFKFIVSTRLSADDTDTGATKCAAFVQDAIVLAVAEEPSVSVSVRNDLCDSIQVFSTLSIGATRVEGPAVVGITLDTI